ncbi:hypothetical protein ACQKKX_18545 [Neorhizobium sp. NPDC001467]|uniref:hypothetical protein n=1 Tax=Neorhizobium sp. NPDC001467 TaxID=3390595 RepID=UPI003CFEAF5A
MQTLFLIALGFVSGSAIIAGAIYLAIRLPGLSRKRRFAAATVHSDSKPDGMVFTAAAISHCISDSGFGGSGDGGGGGDC